MRYFSIVLALVLLSSCATRYEDTIRGGHKYDWESTKKPVDVASCVIARTEAQRPWRATQRPLGDRGAIELLIGPASGGVTAVAHVEPSRYGSKIEAWITALGVLTRDVWHEQFFGGC